MSQRVHIVHVVYRFAAGGLENVIVQLINGLPRDRFRHTVVALTTVDDHFRQRVQHDDVAFVALNKAPGQPFGMYPRFFSLLRRLRPDVFHSCNIAALEFAPVAAAAGVPLRVHAEHGWDVADPDGRNRKYQLLRRVYQRFVHRFVVVSDDLREYLLRRVKVAPHRIEHISNGVDTRVFSPRHADSPAPSGWPFAPDEWVIGTVGRLEPIKNQRLLAEAFVAAVRDEPELTRTWRLAIVGDGPLRAPIAQVLDAAGLRSRVWMPGARSDVPAVLRFIDCFVLPSLAEGTSCTLQEAMATGLPIIATAVGGNPALLAQGTWGRLVPSDDVPALQRALVAASRAQADDRHAQRALALREHAHSQHGLDRVLARYSHIFLGGDHG